MLFRSLYALRFNTSAPYGWQVIGEGAEVGMSAERRDILTVLQQEGAKRPADIARLLGNKNVVTVRRLIQKLSADGLIRKQSDGTYVPSPDVLPHSYVNGVNEGEEG